MSDGKRNPIDKPYRHTYEGEHQDDSMPRVLGIISGITQGIVTEAQLALRPDQTTTVEYYQDVLKRILAEAERAERVWSRWISRELPEHKEISG